MQAAASTAPADSIATRPAPPVPTEVPLPGVAVTKLAPPRLRAGLVARPALERRLANAIVASRLVLLSAPAGFGKTTALARQLALLPAGTATAWISADPDDDLASLLAALLAALAPLDLPWHGAPATLLAAQGHQPTHRPALAWALQNALAAAPVPRGVIVIDDAHRITDPAAFAFLDALLERLPGHWSLLLASRQAPPLALARLRALGELAELQPAELQFSPAETQALARSRAPGWPDAAVQRLHERTQGWPAGISLALAQAPSARAHEPAGPLPVLGRIPECGVRRYTSDRAVFDYLDSEALAGLPAALRDFLLRCAALSEWSTDACADVSGRHDAA
ncbi:MAG TPA: AAA family ATPase, partial [Ideonella sp.]|nr:AAA family ATPase [Ideonella sp.]